MRRITILLFVMFTCFIVYSQNYEVNETLIFNGVKNLNSSGDVIEELDAKGLIIFSNIDGNDIICITIGSTITYTIQYSNSIETKTIGETKIESFYGGTMLGGKMIPIRLNKIYNIRKNSILPEEVQVLIFHSETNRMVSGQTFCGIIKGKTQ